MERGIEDGDLRDAREQCACGIDAHPFARVMRGRQRLERDERALDLVVDSHRMRKARAAMHDAMPDRTQTVEVDPGIAHRVARRSNRVPTAPDADRSFDRRRRRTARQLQCETGVHRVGDIPPREFYLGRGRSDRRVIRSNVPIRRDLPSGRAAVEN